MGVLFSALTEWAMGSKQAQMLILGLDASGKTTILNRLKFNTNAVTVPTIGFNTETIEFGNLKFVAFDIGGQDNIRRLWYHYFDKTDAVVFVVDSADTNRFYLAKKELHTLMNNPLLSHCPFLVFANKQDLPRAATTSQLTNALDLYSISKRVQWKVCESVGTSGMGIDEGFSWLSNSV